MFKALDGTFEGVCKMYDYKVIETKIPNTKMSILLKDNQEISYNITPFGGYKLHAKELDSEDDMTGEIVLGYTEGKKSCPLDYDFEENPREFYAVEIGGDE